MHAKLGCLAALTAVVAASAAASDVVDLGKDTFDDFVKDNNLVLAEFFAPWCGHCKALAPEYETAATTLKEKNIRLAKVDCTAEADLCQSYGIEGYPTLKVFRGLDNISPYAGQRKADAITSFMVKQSLPAVSILTKDTLEEFKTSDKVVIVAYLAEDDKTSNETYTALAEKLRDTYLFGGVNDAAVAAAEGVKAPALVLYKQFDEGKAIFPGAKLDADEIEKFAKTAATPLIGEVGPETYGDYMSAGIPLAYIFAETPEERKTLGEALKPLAEKHRALLNIATIDAKAFGAHAGNLNLKTDKFPSFAIQDVVNNKKFPFDQEKEITVEGITAFVTDFIAGKIQPSIKSEPIPESQDEPVTIVVAHNYEQVVLDDAKDVLVEFYAPWCGHCKALAPKYEELGALYAASEFKDQVVIAKVDATLNDVPDEIKGFPTIKLFPAGAKEEAVTYSGPRTVEDLIKFIAEHGKYKADVSPKEDATEAAEPAVEEKPATPAAESATPVPTADKKAEEKTEHVDL